MTNLDKLISKMLSKTIEVTHEGKTLTVIPVSEAQNLITQAYKQANKEVKTGFSIQEQKITKSLQRLNKLLDAHIK